MGWGLIIALFASFLIAAAIFHILRKLIPLVVHGVLGLAFFWLLNYFGILLVPIDAATFLIAALGGVLGVVLVIILTFLGVPL
ncbi:MAG: pro-sigmaK processing inhibitor BofA family protein [Candidatus Micrarchaeota archaeon]|nr:pro-sigmaK processing inhibitor BofA family protein [Candidatus Micrarchaeota archaeon]